MNNKLVLTSAVIFGFICPAMATPSHTSDTFPSNGLMEADYTYTGQATYDNIGAYGGDIRTLQSATPVPGKTFKGWRFSAPAQSGS